LKTEYKHKLENLNEIEKTQVILVLYFFKFLVIILGSYLIAKISDVWYPDIPIHIRMIYVYLIYNCVYWHTIIIRAMEHIEK
jgi:hypothetical protein